VGSKNKEAKLSGGHYLCQRMEETGKSNGTLHPNCLFEPDWANWAESRFLGGFILH